MNTQISKLLESAFQNYNFGDDVMVVGQDGWQDKGSIDYIKVVYIEFDEENDSDEATSEKVSFHVILNEDKNSVVESYALLVSSGAIIGFSDN